MARPFAGRILKCLHCGGEFKRSQSRIARGQYKYCSLECSGSDHTGDKNPSYKHGNAKRSGESLEFRSWRAIKDRCYRPSSSSYKNYGAKGIKMCDRWLNSFPNFLEDMGLKPTPGHSIDRINSGGNYEPSNCRWATNIEQSNNQRSNRKIEWQGEVYNVSQLMRHLGIYTETGVYYSRLDRGWSVEKTFNTPHKVGVEKSV